VCVIFIGIERKVRKEEGCERYERRKGAKGGRVRKVRKEEVGKRRKGTKGCREARKQQRQQGTCYPTTSKGSAKILRQAQDDSHNSSSRVLQEIPGTLHLRLLFFR
jgi:hypothetical protein